MQISEYLLTGLVIVIVALVMLIFAATIPIWAEPKSKKPKNKEEEESK